MNKQHVEKYPFNMLLALSNEEIAMKALVVLLAFLILLGCHANENTVDPAPAPIAVPVNLITSWFYEPSTHILNINATYQVPSSLSSSGRKGKQLPPIITENTIRIGYSVSPCSDCSSVGNQLGFNLKDIDLGNYQVYDQTTGNFLAEIDTRKLSGGLINGQLVSPSSSP